MGRAAATMVFLITISVLAGGCSDTKINDVVVKLFEPRRTPQQQMIVAFASEDPDLRRAALAQVAKSKQYDRDWAIKGYMAVALFDTDSQARCVALRALTRTGDPRAVETALKLLNYRDYAAQEVRPPEALCRWDATEGLTRLSETGKIPDEQRDKVRSTLIDRLRLDTDRHVRIAAARGLACHAHEESVRALIERMNDEDFAVVHQCEGSLVRLTGQTHNCDPLAWERWLAANESTMFARSGEVPESRRPPYKNAFEKTGYDLMQFWRWLVPASKD